MDETTAAFEGDMLKLTERMLRQWETKFQNLGVTVTVPTLRQSGSAQHYESEVEVHFEDANGIFDAVTFFVYRDGRRVASHTDVEAWLTEDLNDVLARRLSEAEGNARP